MRLIASRVAPKNTRTNGVGVFEHVVYVDGPQASDGQRKDAGQNKHDDDKRWVCYALNVTLQRQGAERSLKARMGKVIFLSGNVLQQNWGMCLHV
jgi:hypothetical protein